MKVNNTYKLFLAIKRDDYPDDEGFQLIQHTMQARDKEHVYTYLCQNPDSQDNLGTFVIHALCILTQKEYRDLIQQYEEEGIEFPPYVEDFYEFLDLFQLWDELDVREIDQIK